MAASLYSEWHALGDGLTGRRAALEEVGLQLDIIVPVIMACALLWWVGREMSLTARLTVAAVTLALILVGLMFERSPP